MIDSPSFYRLSVAKEVAKAMPRCRWQGEGHSFVCRGRQNRGNALARRFCRAPQTFKVPTNYFAMYSAGEISWFESNRGRQKISFFGTRFFYPLRKQWYIITRQREYHQKAAHRLCISSRFSVYQKPFAMMIYKTKVLMICNSYGIDDIQCFALICRSFYAIIY